MPHLFDPQTYPDREMYYTAAVAAGFGAPPDVYRALVTKPGRSWHTAALGLTLSAYAHEVPPAMRAILTPANDQGRWARAVSRGSGEEQPPPIARVLRQLERLPDAMFIRFLEWLNYPAIVLQAAHTTWDTLEKHLSRSRAWADERSGALWEAGRHFLGDVRIMRDRLRAGGLLAPDRDKLNVLALGMIGPSLVLPRWLQDLIVLGDWIGDGFHRPTGDEDIEPDMPDAPGSSGLICQPRFHLFGLELETRIGDASAMHSTLGMRGTPALYFHPAALPENLSVEAALHEHAARWSLEHCRRRVLYRVSSTVVGLVLRYITLGPVGLVISALHLIAEGILSVAPSARRLIWPEMLPGVETA